MHDRNNFMEFLGGLNFQKFLKNISGQLMTIKLSLGFKSSDFKFYCPKKIVFFNFNKI